MAQQEGLDRCRLSEEYYDIMLVGMTGQGKSTLADKLLIANPEGKKYELPAEMNQTSVPVGEGGPQKASNEVKVTLTDFSTWILHETDEQKIETHLKGLVYSRTKPEPHMEVNKIRDPKEGESTSTGDCQVFSNDDTKIRVMDVPGFEDARAWKSSSSSEAGDGNLLSPVHLTASNVVTFHMSLTRNIIRIQSALGMCFRRIVYFLPGRGPLERSHAVLKNQLQSLEYAFGKSIFKSMIAVATIQRRYSLKKEPDEEKFPQEDEEQCTLYFEEALRQVLGNEDIPKVPIVFISLSETCESILRKVKDAPVSCDHLKLEFNPSTCASCGLKIQSRNGEKVACAFPERPDDTFPYDDSTCHPAFKQHLIRRLLGQKISSFISRRWPSYKEEYCIKCEECPFKRGCMKVKQTYTFGSKVYEIDHTNKILEPVDTSVQSRATPSVADSVASSVQGMDIRGGSVQETREDEDMFEYKGT